MKSTEGKEHIKLKGVSFCYCSVLFLFFDLANKRRGTMFGGCPHTIVSLEDMISLA